MRRNPTEFARFLTQAIGKIALESYTTKAFIQDELGHALSRSGGSTIDYWRRGNIPAHPSDVEILARELYKRGGLNCQQLEALLRSANFPTSNDLLAELCPLKQTKSESDQAFALEMSSFVVGVPITIPRQFFGRQEELTRIFQAWRRFPLQHVAIIGLRRSGKTSLLHYVKSICLTASGELRLGQRNDWLSQPEFYRWIYIDFQDPRWRHPETLLRFILNELQMSAPNPCTLSAFMDTVSHKLDKPTIIMMDEIGAALQEPGLDLSFWWSLRSWGTNQANGKLAFVIAGHEDPAKLAQDEGKPSPFFNIFGHIPLGPFIEAEARALITNSPRPLAPDDIDWIIEHSQCWPNLLQILCQARLDALEAGQFDDNWQTLGLSQIKSFQYLL